MAYFFVVLSSLVTGAIVAVWAVSLGIKHVGIAIAIGVIVAGAQTAGLLVWYLWATRRRARRQVDG